MKRSHERALREMLADEHRQSAEQAISGYMANHLDRFLASADDAFRVGLLARGLDRAFFVLWCPKRSFIRQAANDRSQTEVDAVDPSGLGLLICVNE